MDEQRLLPGLGRALVPTRAGRPVTARRRWVASPLGAALAEAAPGLLGAAARAAAGTRREGGTAAGVGRHGFAVTQVEIGTADNWGQRLIVRSTRSWDVAPGVGSERRRGRVGLGALGVGGLLLGLAAARRARRSRWSAGRPWQGSGA